MSRRFSAFSRGSVALAALCCVTVLGIAVAGYFAQSNQSMRLSNRNYALGVSAQLAETGLEEALRAFNANDFSDWTSGTSPNQTAVDWTLSGTTATATITFPASKYGASGNIGSVKLRVDNYNAYNRSSTWSASTNYRVGDLVGNSGIWYRCVQNHSNQTPGNLAYWVPAPIAWEWSKSTAYALYDIVNYGGVWYRCITVNSDAVFTSSNWLAIPSISLAWSANTAYPRGALTFNSGVWYYCTDAHTSPGSWSVTNWVSMSVPANTWAASTAYAVGNYVYRGSNSTWYRCVTAHTSTATFDTVKFITTSGAPYISWMYRAVAHVFDDKVFYSLTGGGSWYRYYSGTSTSNAPTDTNYWQDPLTNGAWLWSSGTTYHQNDAVYRGGSWYRCISDHANHVPPNTTYWSDAPLASPTWNSTKQYAVNDTVTYGGIWYRCLVANNSSNPSLNASNWASAVNATYQWSSATSYTTSSYVAYGGVWHRCIIANAAYSPNNATYWTALGTPVIYAEGTVTPPNGSAAIKTQVRATVAPAPLLPNALAANSTLSLTFNNATNIIDSYDADAASYVAPGGFSAVVAGGNTTATAVTFTSGTIQGYVAAPSNSSSPYAPLTSFGANAIVESATSPASPKVDLSRVSRSPNIPQFSVNSVVSGSSIPLSPSWPTGGISIGTSGATTPSVYTYSGDLDLNLSTEILTIIGPVILNVTGYLRVRSSGRIIITSTGSAEIHFGDSLRITTTGYINNQTLDPKKLSLISGVSSSGAAHNITTTTDLYGVIYIPNATSTLTVASASSTFEVFGAISTKTLTFSNYTKVHYDTSLRYTRINGVESPFSVSEWRELTNLSERVILP